MPVDANGVPFDMSHIYASGNLAADMYQRHVLEELGGPQALPIPNSFPREQEMREFSYAFLSTATDGAEPPTGRWSEGESIDGHGEFHLEPAQPLGEEPVLSDPAEASFAQTEQFRGGLGASPHSGNPDRPEQMGGGTMDRLKDRLTGG